MTRSKRRTRETAWSVGSHWADVLDDGFRSRHAELALVHAGGAGDPVDPAQVQAMAMVLHLPKAQPPRRSALLAAAATACAALCLDERVGVDGPWEQPYLAWKRTRIRKVARRARGAHWAAANDVAGLVAEVDGAQAMALVPGPVGELDPRIKRLQIGGTDLAHDQPADPEPGLPVLWVAADLGMTLGKAAAQVGHASMLLAGAMPVEDAYAWSSAGFRCAVREADAQRWAQLGTLVGQGKAVAVRDAGFTEVAPGSTTVIGVP